jgi:hypothetical protein
VLNTEGIVSKHALFVSCGLRWISRSVGLPLYRLDSAHPTGGNYVISVPNTLNLLGKSAYGSVCLIEIA